ncbi:unnamed protein product, partial [Rotaria sordida]
LVDLGDANHITLKLSFDIATENEASDGTETVGAAQMVTNKMAKQTGEVLIKVRKLKTTQTIIIRR